MMNVSTSLKTHFVPTTEHLEHVKHVFEWGEEGNEVSYDKIRNSSLDVLTAKYRNLMNSLLLYREEHKKTNIFDPLKKYYKGYFSSKEEFLCFMGQISQWLYECDLGSLGSNMSQRLISNIFETEYSFFCRFCDEKELYKYYD